MKFTNAIICLVATASTVTAQDQVACAGFTCRSPENFPSGFDFKEPMLSIPLLTTINDIQPPSGENLFVSEFVAITDSKDLGTVFPVNLALIGAQNAKPTGGAPIFFGDESRSLLGTIFYTNGDLYNSVTLEEQNEIDAQKSNINLFIGGREVTATVPENPVEGFTFRGQCTVVSDQVKLSTNKSAGPGSPDQFFAQISGHTCLYDMCFGDSNCILIYSGTPFVFDIRSGELPPGFSGFVAGGTGSFAGIGGSVDILTVTGRTTIGNFSPDLLIGTATVFPAQPGTQGGSFNEQNGDITQKIFLSTNQQLPPVPV
jgi:hypothetical protein